MSARTSAANHPGRRRRGPIPGVRPLVLYGLLGVVALLWLAPFAWMVATSLKEEEDIFSYPVRWLPSPPTIDYYTGLFEAFPLLRWFRNSLVVAVLTTALALVIDSLAAYPLARMRFPGRRAVMILILATFLLPAEILLVPLFLGLSRAGIVDSFFSLSVPPAVNAFGVFLLTQFFQTVPAELEDAAIVDGSTRFGFSWRILLPLSVPALVTVAITTFVASWNNLFWPLIVTNSDATRTLPVGLTSLVGGAGMSMRFGILMAAAVAATLPALVFFLALQRYFVRGIATTGLKG
jgi:multiple sugar transport system permease protein